MYGLRRCSLSSSVEWLSEVSVRRVVVGVVVALVRCWVAKVRKWMLLVMVLVVFRLCSIVCWLLMWSAYR